MEKIIRKMTKTESNTGKNSKAALEKRHKLHTMKEVVDLLKGSHLVATKAQVTDVITYGEQGSFAKRSGGQMLTRNTASCMYEYLLLDRFLSLDSVYRQPQMQLNEVIPLLYVSVKLSLAADPKTSLETLHLVGSLDDFRKEDPQMKLLGMNHLPAVYKPVEMIARLYVLDSLQYPDEAEYWLNYAHNLATKLYESHKMSMGSVKA